MLYFKYINLICWMQLAVCERQLADANEQIGDIKDRLEQFEDAHDMIKKDFEKVCFEVCFREVMQ